MIFKRTKYYFVTYAHGRGFGNIYFKASPDLDIKAAELAVQKYMAGKTLVTVEGLGEFISYVKAHESDFDSFNVSIVESVFTALYHYLQATTPPNTNTNHREGQDND